METSVNFGLGDWSMTKGMGFWDYVTEAQVDYDNGVYPVNRRDSEIAQKGTIRVASYANAQWATTLLSGRDVMSLQYELRFAELASPSQRGRHPGQIVYRRASAFREQMLTSMLSKLMGSSNSVQARHILVEQEYEAQDVCVNSSRVKRSMISPGFFRSARRRARAAIWAPSNRAKWSRLSKKRPSR